MTLASRSTWFVLGAASAWAVPLAYKAIKGSLAGTKSEVQRGRQRKCDGGDKQQCTTQTAESKTMDAADLDLRIIRKAEGVIRHRTSGITIVIERCTNDWNYSAILRTAEALGIQNVFIVDPPVVMVDPSDNETQTRMPNVLLTKEELANRRAHHLFAQNATDWLTITNCSSSQECIDMLLASGHTIWATDLSQQAIPLTEMELTEANCWPIFPKKLALVFGTEAVGVSQTFLQQAHQRVYLPLYGFADSLNLSVATALVVFAVLQLEPRYIGNLSDEEQHSLRSKWFPKLAQQRLLTSSQKKRRNKLLALIESCKVLAEKKRRYEQQGSRQVLGSSEGRDLVFPLTNEQSQKLDKLPQLQQELHELESSARFHDGALQAVADLIDNPPEPLTDLRRIDQHRICFVGKNTKSMYKEAWQGLAATTTKPIGTTKYLHGSSAGYFRSRAQDA